MKPASTDHASVPKTLSDRWIWCVVVTANVLALAAAYWLWPRWPGNQPPANSGAPPAFSAGDILTMLSVFAYLETFVGVIWYTMVSRQMQSAMVRQTDLQTSALRGAVLESMRSAMLTINQLFVSHPHLRQYFYEGKVFVYDPRNPDQKKLHPELSAVADCLLDIFENVDYHLNNSPGDHVEYLKVWENYVTDVFATSPFLNNYFEQHQNWYVPVMQKYRRQHPLPVPARSPLGKALRRAALAGIFLWLCQLFLRR